MQGLPKCLETADSRAPKLKVMDLASGSLFKSYEKVEVASLSFFASFMLIASLCMGGLHSAAQTVTTTWTVRWKRRVVVLADAGRMQELQYVTRISALCFSKSDELVERGQSQSYKPAAFDKPNVLFDSVHLAHGDGFTQVAEDLSSLKQQANGRQVVQLTLSS